MRYIVSSRPYTEHLPLTWGNHIHQITINQREYSSIAEGLDNAISLDYHYARGYIYWTDVTLDAIKRAYLNGSGEIGE